MRSRESYASREPRRPEAGRRRFSAESRQRLRDLATAARPWEKTRGPISQEGKARSAYNGRFNQRGERSRRELRAELAGVLSLMDQMEATWSSLMRTEVLGAHCSTPIRRGSKITDFGCPT
jgi:hypothetical protein